MLSYPDLSRVRSSLFAYPDSEEGRQELDEVYKTGSFRTRETVMKETERFKRLINEDILLPTKDQAWREPLVVALQNHGPKSARGRGGPCCGALVQKEEDGTVLQSESTLRGSRSVQHF